MNVSYEWLRAFVPFEETPTQLRDLLTSRVATVDDVVPLREDLAPIVVARVVEAAPHPDSDHLWVTKVDAGTGELLDVVCGAPNVRAGKLYPFARAGATLPGGLKIERRKIRGRTSNGMLCSAAELELGVDHDGILELDVDAAPGTPFTRAMSVGDSRIVVDVLPNRPDLLSHVGVARELAALTGKPLAWPALLGADAPIPAPERVMRQGMAGPIAVRVDDPALAPQYCAVVIRGVTVGASPQWLVQRLASVGLRSINNVVDATNYVLHELGQPTHAFDLAKLQGDCVTVRRARAGERLVTLDGVDRPLDPSMTVIADMEHPVALAGVIGGQASEVTETTMAVFLEVARFAPDAVRTTRRAAGVSTDASYRFERGIDPELPTVALVRTTQLILAIAGGQLEGAPLQVGSPGASRATVPLRAARVERVLGAAVPLDECATLLQSIGFQTEAEAEGGALRATPPSWRHDVAQEVDLIEEIARLHGYERLPDTLGPQRPGTVPDAADWTTARRVREALVGAGLLEVRPMPFVEGAEHGFVRLANPLAESEAYLRRELLDTLARRAEYNLARMQGDVRIFEIGSAFVPELPHPAEDLRVAALVMGDRQPRHFTQPKPERFDEWDARWLGELIARAAYPHSAIELRPGSGSTLWDIVREGAVVGVVRGVELDAPVWAAPAFGVELLLSTTSAAATAPPGQRAERGEARVAPPARPAKYRPPAPFPAAEFDLALLVPEGVTADRLGAAIRAAAGELLERLELFDLYEGKGVEPGHRSLAWRLTFRHPERTLRDKEIEARRANILKALEGELHVRARAV